MAAVLEGIKVGRVGALPSQHDLVWIVVITHLGVGGQGGSVGDTHGAVAVATLDAVGINALRFVDLAQTGFDHADGHGVGGIIVTHGKFAGVLGPGGDLVGAASVLKELNDHIVLVVANALRHGINISIFAERRRLGGNRGQGADDLIIHRVAHGGGGSVSVPIGDVSQAAVVLAGGVLCFTHGLLQRRVAGLVLGVNGDIVVPRRAVDGSHGQRYEERIAGGGDIFRDASLHHQIKPLLHIGSRGVSGGIGLRHSNTTVFDRNFQSILHSGGIGSQRGGQLVVEHIAGEVVDAIVGLVSVCVGQADGRQHGGAAITVVEAIQHTHLTLTIQQFIVHGDVGNTEVSKLHALDGVLAQFINDSVVMQAGGNIGLHIPRAVVAGLGDVILVDAQGCFFAGVDGRLGKCRCHEADGHERRQNQCHYAMDLFHSVVSFLMLDFLQK